jgi:cytoskeletal protein RodZ
MNDVINNKNKVVRDKTLIERFYNLSKRSKILIFIGAGIFVTLIIIAIIFASLPKGDSYIPVTEPEPERTTETTTKFTGTTTPSTPSQIITTPSTPSIPSIPSTPSTPELNPSTPSTPSTPEPITNSPEPTNPNPNPPSTLITRDGWNAAQPKAVKILVPPKIIVLGDIKCSECTDLVSRFSSSCNPF